MRQEPEKPDDPRLLAGARLRGRRLALGVVIVVSVAFIGASVAQIVRGVFGAEIAPLPAGEPGSAEWACAVGVRGLKLALDRASGRVLSPSGPAEEGDDADDPGAALAEGLSPEWKGAEAVRRACADVREGRDAWAALERLLHAQQELARHAHAELAPLRRDVIAHLPTDLR